MDFILTLLMWGIILVVVWFTCIFIFHKLESFFTISRSSGDDQIDKYHALYGRWYSLAKPEDATNSVFMDTFWPDSPWYQWVVKSSVARSGIPPYHYDYYSKILTKTLRPFLGTFESLEWRNLRFKQTQDSTVADSALNASSSEVSAEIAHLEASIPFLENFDDEVKRFGTSLADFFSHIIALSHQHAPPGHESDYFVSFETIAADVIPDIFIANFFDKAIYASGAISLNTTSAKRGPAEEFASMVRCHFKYRYDSLQFVARRDLGESVRQLASDRIDDYEEAYETKYKSDRLASDDEISPNAVFSDFMDSLHLGAFFIDRVNYGILKETRFSHMWVVAKPGSGKSNLLKKFLYKDFADVAANKASVIVMESNRDLIKSIERFSLFAKGQALQDRLLLIDCDDVNFPVSVNLFDLDLGDTSSLNDRDRMALKNTAMDLLDYVLYSLIGADFTDKQEILFENCVQLMFVIPNANLDTFVHILRNGIDEYKELIHLLPDHCSDFFLNEFNATGTGGYKSTKTEVVNRIHSLRKNEAFARIFSSTKTKLNLYEAMESSKVILINTSMDLLGEKGVELFGRYMIALVFAATQKRAVFNPSARHATYFYVDEAHDYVANDTKLPKLLAQTRKLNLGMILAHQFIGQIENEKVRAALAGATNIRMVSAVSDADAKFFASDMNVEKDVFSMIPMHSFLVSANQREPFETQLLDVGAFDTSEFRMSDAEYQEVVDANREAVAFDYQQVTQLKVAEKRAKYLSKDDFRHKFVDPLKDGGDDDDDLV